MRKKKITRKIQRAGIGRSDHVAMILITLFMVTVKLIGNSWSLDCLMPRDIEAEEEKVYVILECSTVTAKCT